MTIVLLGANELIARFAAKTALGIAAAEVGRDELGHDVETLAKEYVPVLTGTLQDSITYADGQVSTDVVYAAQVEYGGLHNPPEPYMRPAADTVSPERALGAAKVIVDSG